MRMHIATATNGAISVLLHTPIAKGRDNTLALSKRNHQYDRYSLSVHLIKRHVQFSTEIALLDTLALSEHTTRQTRSSRA
jgi:hypothetical protein